MLRSIPGIRFRKIRVRKCCSIAQFLHYVSQIPESHFEELLIGRFPALTFFCISRKSVSKKDPDPLDKMRRFQIPGYDTAGKINDLNSPREGYEL